MTTERNKRMILPSQGIEPCTSCFPGRRISHFTRKERLSLVSFRPVLCSKGNTSDITNAYPSLVILRNKSGQTARIQSINMDLVHKLITFLRPWKNILNELQRTNAPSLFLTLPCTIYILDQLATGIKSEKSGNYNCFVSFFLLNFSAVSRRTHRTSSDTNEM